MGQKLVWSLIYALLMVVLPGNLVAAVPLSNDIINHGSPDTHFMGRYLKPSEIIAIFPMSEEAEAKIIHVIPQCPVILEGEVINPEDLARFNGRRLHFVTEKVGTLHAFTDVIEMERFVEAEYGPVFEQATAGIRLLLDISELFADWYYGGDKLSVEPGRVQAQLAGWDNRISSTRINSSVPLTFWDYEYFGGDSFTMLPGSKHSALVFEGWNDRASSFS